VAHSVSARRLLESSGSLPREDEPLQDLLASRSSRRRITHLRSVSLASLGLASAAAVLGAVMSSAVQGRVWAPWLAAGITAGFVFAMLPAIRRPHQSWLADVLVGAKSAHGGSASQRTLVASNAGILIGLVITRALLHTEGAKASFISGAGGFIVTTVMTLALITLACEVAVQRQMDCGEYTDAALEPTVPQKWHALPRYQQVMWGCGLAAAAGFVLMTVFIRWI
jgi:hypothetical protein